MEKRVKLVVIGDGGVGKTSWVGKLKDLQFNENYIPTLGVEVTQFDYESGNGLIKYSIWDLAGQDRFAGLRDGYLIGADAGVIMYDCTSIHTKSSASCWRRDLKRMVEGIPVVHVCNKTDLSSNQEEWVDNKLQTIMISVKRNQNVLEPLAALSRILPQHLYMDLQNACDYFKDN